MVSQAGVWRERGAKSILDHQVIPMVPDLRFAGLIQWAVRDEDAGQYLICVDYSAARAAPRHNDVVIIIRSTGDLEEITVRKLDLSTSDGVCRLLSDPENTTSMADPTARIIGLCIGTYKPLTA